MYGYLKFMSRLVKPKNHLKAKVGTGGFRAEDIEKAQTVIEENDVDFAPIASRYLDLVAKAINDYSATDYSSLYSELLGHLSQLRAQGAMFQYASITALTDTVVDLLDTTRFMDDKILEIVIAYEKSARVLLGAKIKEADDKTCQALVAELSSVCKRYKQRME